MIAVGGGARWLISAPWPRAMTPLPQGDLPTGAAIVRTAARRNQANVGVYAYVIAGGAIGRDDRGTLA